MQMSMHDNEQCCVLRQEQQKAKKEEAAREKEAEAAAQAEREAAKQAAKDKGAAPKKQVLTLLSAKYSRYFLCLQVPVSSVMAKPSSEAKLSL